MSIPALGKLRQKDHHELEGSLVYSRRLDRGPGIGREEGKSGFRADAAAADPQN